MSESKPPLVNEDQSPRAAAAAVLALHFGRMRANEAGTLAGSDPEALHDLRVATRRLRAAFRVFRDVFDENALAAANDDARWVAQTLGTVRDLDVFIEWLRAHAPTAPVLQRAFVQELIARSDAERVERRAGALTALKSERYHGFVQQFKAFLSALDEPVPSVPPNDEVAVVAELMRVAGVDEATARSWWSSRPQPPSLRSFAEAAIRRQHKRLRKFGRKFGPDDLESLHAVRIGCKRLRYACEFFRDLFTDRLTLPIKQMVELQDALGAMRDAHLQAERVLVDFRRHFAEVPRRMALLRVLRALRQRERQEYATFRAAWREFLKLGIKHVNR